MHRSSLFSLCLALPLLTACGGGSNVSLQGNEVHVSTSKLDITFAPDKESLAAHLPGKEILLGWNFSGRDLRDCWHAVDGLRWIHWCGAGVDAALFPGLFGEALGVGFGRKSTEGGSVKPVVIETTDQRVELSDRFSLLSLS